MTMQRYAYNHDTHNLVTLADGEVGKNHAGEDVVSNQWVKFADAKEALSEEYKNGWDNGYEVGRNAPGQEVSQTKLSAEFNRGHTAGYSNKVTEVLSELAQEVAKEFAKEPAQADANTDTRRLINELYHDRARLERAVQDACGVINALIEASRGRPLYNVDDTEMSQIEAVNFAVALGQQYQDTHEA